MVLCIIRENKKIVDKFNFGNNIDTSKYPLEDGTFILKKQIDDCCSICFENFNIDDKIVKWPRCDHPFHQHCYKTVRIEHNILSCPICRSKIERIKYKKRYNYICDDDDDYLCKKEKKYNDINCFYIDKQGNLNIRSKIFCQKYNFHIESNRLCMYYNLPVLMLFNFVSLVLNEEFEEINNLIDKILYKFIFKKDSKVIKKTYKIVVDNLTQFSNIFNVDLLSFFENKFNDKIKMLIESDKKMLSSSLHIFKSSIEGEIWFNIHSLNQRKKFYQEKLSKIGGEKYRKIFMAENFNDFSYNISIIK